MVSEAPEVIQDMALWAILVPAGLILLGIIYGMAMWGEHTVREWKAPRSTSNAYHTGHQGPLGWNGEGLRRTYQGAPLQDLLRRSGTIPEEEEKENGNAVSQHQGVAERDDDATTVVSEDAASEITAVEGSRWKLRAEGFSTTSRAGGSGVRARAPRRDRVPRSLRGTVRIIDESGQERIIYPHNI